jgi:hypothetical protein
MLSGVNVFEISDIQEGQMAKAVPNKATRMLHWLKTAE